MQLAQLPRSAATGDESAHPSVGEESPSVAGMLRTTTEHHRHLSPRRRNNAALSVREPMAAIPARHGGSCVESVTVVACQSDRSNCSLTADVDRIVYTWELFAEKRHE